MNSIDYGAWLCMIDARDGDEEMFDDSNLVYAVCNHCGWTQGISRQEAARIPGIRCLHDVPDFGRCKGLTKPVADQAAARTAFALGGWDALEGMELLP